MPNSEYEFLHRPKHLQPWVIALMFFLWPTIITLIIGVVLLILEREYSKNLAANIDDAIQHIRDSEEAKKLQYEQHLDDKHKERMQKLDEEYEQKISDTSGRMQTLNCQVADLSSQKIMLEGQIDDLEKEFTVRAVDVDAYEDLRSDQVKNELQLLRMKQKEMIKDGSAVLVLARGYSQKGISIATKQILFGFNAESVSIIESVTVKNIDSKRNKLQRSYENINKLFAGQVQISEGYLKTKFEEMSLIYSYMVKLEEERELQKAIREQLQEEEKVRREIEREKAKIDKESAQFSGEVNKLMSYLQKAKDDVEKQLYVDKIKELEEKLKLLEKDRENVLEREQNTRAGFVYIISNIGSFGEDVYKIGMTRRLEPMDRVKELGSASVPFTFDVHAMIFSEDAPGLESTLHQTFKANQVNKVNPRKEFFKVDLDSIKKIVTENHNATVQFVDLPDAIEYGESIRLEEVRAMA